MKVADIFGPTVQGEGPTAGRLAMFLRLGRCNLDCGWCDEKQTWDWTHFDPAVTLHDQSPDDVLAALHAIDAPTLVITGGEPLLQQPSLIAVLTAAERRWRVEVETNGTIVPDPGLVELVDQWNVSPKLANSGVTRTRRVHPAALTALSSTGRAVAKFVVTDPADLDEVAEIADLGELTDVWVMPEGTTPAVLTARLSLLAPHVIARGWNLSSRLHVFAGVS
jgi:7-carboxy-7-deazaguanine synthase